VGNFFGIDDVHFDVVTDVKPSFSSSDPETLIRPEFPVFRPICFRVIWDTNGI